MTLVEFNGSHESSVVSHKFWNLSQGSESGLVGLQENSILFLWLLNLLHMANHNILFNYNLLSSPKNNYLAIVTCFFLQRKTPTPFCFLLMMSFLFMN